MRVSSLFQFLIGFFLGIIFFTGGIAGGAYLFLTGVSSNPSKPDFSKEKEQVEPTKEEKPVAKEEKEAAPVAEKPKPEEKKEEAKEELPAGAYRARVTWSTGLSLRGGPSESAERVGGVDYNAELIILNSSNDGRWQRVRTSNGQEAWVKAGNVRKVEN